MQYTKLQKINKCVLREVFGLFCFCPQGQKYPMMKHHNAEKGRKAEDQHSFMSLT